MSKTTLLLISSAFALAGCTSMTTPAQLSFDTLSVEKRVTLTTDTNSPAYEMKINVKYVKEGSDDMRKSVNDAITAKIFNLHNVDIKMAVDSFVNENTRTYLKDMRPLYMEDKRDIDRRPIYEYAADIKTRTEDGREGVVTYFIDMYNFEGGAHGLTQLLTLNFDKATGKTIVKVNPKFFRPAEVDILLGNPAKAEEKLGWKREISFSELVERMVKNDLALVEKELKIKSVIG